MTEPRFPLSPEELDHIEERLEALSFLHETGWIHDIRQLVAQARTLPQAEPSRRDPPSDIIQELARELQNTQRILHEIASNTREAGWSTVAQKAEQGRAKANAALVHALKYLELPLHEIDPEVPSH